MSHPLTTQQKTWSAFEPNHLIDLCNVFDSCNTSDRPAWECLSTLLNEARELHAQELHIEPDQDCWRLRLRSAFTFTETRLADLATYQSCLNTLQQRLWPDMTQSIPRRSWFGFHVNSVDQLIQLDVVPGARGASYLFRILHPLKAPPPRLDELAMSREQQAVTRELLKQGSGLILLTGDLTQSRAQTARAMAQELVSPDRKIVCADCPGHPIIPRTTQLAMETPATREQQRSWTTMCHMNCDAIIACQPLEADVCRHSSHMASADTLVIQSIDSRTAADAVDRMLTMGVRCETLARTLNIIIVQRQVQCVCPYCRHTEVPDDTGTAWLAEHSPIKAGNINDWLRHRMRSSFSVASGCERCNQSGMGHALDLFDLVIVNNAVKDALYDSNIRHALSLLEEQSSLSRHLMRLAQDGIISLNEAIRVAPIKSG